MGIFTYESRYLRQIALGTHPNGQPFSGPDWVAVSSSWVYHCLPPIPPNPCGPSSLDSLIYKIYPALVDT